MYRGSNVFVDISGYRHLCIEKFPITVFKSSELTCIITLEQRSLRVCSQKRRLYLHRLAATVVQRSQCHRWTLLQEKNNSGRRITRIVYNYYIVYIARGTGWPIT